MHASVSDTRPASASSVSARSRRQAQAQAHASSSEAVVGVRVHQPVLHVADGSIVAARASGPVAAALPTLLQRNAPPAMYTLTLACRYIHHLIILFDCVVHCHQWITHALIGVVWCIVLWA
jgi:hypothetical protein